ncbi:MAG: phytanoyl-CoA dioxygenase family protein [Pseudomonadales bacterium]
MSRLPRFDVPKVDYGPAEDAMRAYREDGTARALALPNRGPLLFDASGRVASHILEAYREYGFYVFSRLIDADELADIEADVIELLERAPVHKGALVDRQGRTALGVGCRGANLSWVRPLSDPLGGTGFAHGRHPVKMVEPGAPDGAPTHVVQLVLGSLQFSDACLRLYGHPDLLRFAEAVNGPDFTPFNEAVWIKHPRLGGSVAWHQDGWTHWESSRLDGDTHGFNFMAQLYGCNAANGLWVVPGSHRQGKVDIRAAVARCGSERLPDAVPLICAPGDVAVTNRQAVHGSFANTSDDPRVTINFGFHRRASVHGVRSGGIHNPVAEYDDAYIERRSRVIGYAIDARRQRFPSETSYRYAPFAGHEARYRWTPEARIDLRDYNLEDLGI